MEDVKIKEWLENNPKSGSGSGYGYSSGSGTGSGSGYGYSSGSGTGYGSGYGYGSGSGDGYGSGTGYGSGYGSGDGYGSGTGYGSGYGSGYGYGSGSGDGYGSGTGYGSGYGIKTFGNDTVYMIDEVQTIIRQIKEQVAKGFILNTDFTLEPCYVVKGNGYFAHGKSIREAQSSLREKIFEDMDSDEAIRIFMDTFEKKKRYKGATFFDWHNYLTGSCLMGREHFVKEHNLSLDDEFTVDEFIALCENSFGREIIKQLKEEWNSK